MKLFDDKIRKSLEIKDGNKNKYDYLNESSIDEIKNIRDSLEKLFSIYPDEEKDEMKKRIESEEQFESTLFEIYLYNLFNEMSFSIETHPKLKDSENRPDFFISKESINIYIEAKVDYNSTNKQRGKEKRLNHVVNLINNIESGNYRLMVQELKILNDNQPSIKNFKNHLENQFKALDYEKVKAITKTETTPLQIYPGDNLYIEYKIIAVSEGHRDKRTIQMRYFDLPEWSTSHRNIRKSLENKKNRYGKLNSPFIIAVNCLDLTVDEHDVMSAVLGGKIITYCNSYGKTVPTSSFHKNDGFFSYKDTKLNNNVSAVLIYKLNESKMRDPKYWFIHNPNAKYPLSLEDITLDSYILKNGKFAKYTYNKT